MPFLVLVLKGCGINWRDLVSVVLKMQFSTLQVWGFFVWIVTGRGSDM